MYWNRMQRCRNSPAQAQTVAVDRGVMCEVCYSQVLGEKVIRRGTGACVAERQKPVCDQHGSV